MAKTRRNLRKRRVQNGGDRIQELKTEIEELESRLRADRNELLSLEHPELVPFIKMKKVGAPEPAIRKKMANAGVNGGLAKFLFGNAPAPPPAPAPVLVPARPAKSAAQIAAASAAAAGKGVQGVAGLALQAQQKALDMQRRREAAAAAALLPPVPNKYLTSNNKGELPKGWFASHDEDGYWYYPESGEPTQWSRPTLPFGWVINTDESGDVWYTNEKLGISQWEVPT